MAHIATNRLEYINSMTNIKLGNHHTRLQTFTTGFNVLGVRANNSDADGDAMMASPDFATGDKTVSNSKLLIHNLMTGARYKDQILGLAHEQAYALWAISKDCMMKPIHPNPGENYPIYGVDIPKLSMATLSKDYRKVVICPISNNQISYFVACFNEFVLLDLDVIKDNFIMDKSWTKNMLLEYYDDSDYTIYLELIFRLHLFTNILTNTISVGNLLFTLRDFALDIPELRTVQHEIVTGVAQRQTYIKKTIGDLDNNNTFKQLLESQVGLKTAQFSVLFAKGYSTDLYSKAVVNNTKDGLSKGLSDIDYWLSSEGARSATKAKESAIPKAGEMLRYMYFGTGLIKNDRGTTHCSQTNPDLEVLIDRSSIKRFYNKRTILFNNEPRYLDIDDKTTYNDIPAGKYKLFGPMDCKLGNFSVCQRCSSKEIEDTYYVGLLASSLISECIIQSSLSSHHTSGSYNLDISDRLMEILGIIKPIELVTDEISFEGYDKTLVDEYIELVKSHYSDPSDIEMVHNTDKRLVEINLLVAPEAEDATKALKNILRSININKRATDPDYQNRELTYSVLFEKILDANSLYSIYLELMLMLLFLDKDGELVQYSGLPEHRKLPISKVIDHFSSIDSSVYNMSNQKLKLIQKTLGQTNEIDHAYDKLFSYYEPSVVNYLGKK